MACGGTVREDHCHYGHVDFLIRTHPPVGKDAPIQRIEKVDHTTSGIPEDQAIFDNDLESIRLHQERYKAKLEIQNKMLHVGKLDGRKGLDNGGGRSVRDA